MSLKNNSKWFPMDTQAHTESFMREEEEEKEDEEKVEECEGRGDE